MKLHSRPAWLFLVAAASMLAMSCMTAPRIPLRDNVAVKKTNYGAPDGSVLVYGSASQAKTIFNALSSKSIDNLEMIQLNPAQKAMIITPARIGRYFYTEPLPQGSSIRFFYFSTTVGRTTTFYDLGLQGRGPTDKKLDKPGLFYLGSLVYCDKGYTEKKTALGPSDMSTMDFYPIGEDKEIDILKEMRPAFKGTEWEPLIAARIEELKK